MSYIHQGKSYGGSSLLKDSSLTERIKKGTTPILCPECKVRSKKQTKHGTYLNYCAPCSNQRAAENRKKQRERNKLVDFSIKK